MTGVLNVLKDANFYIEGQDYLGKGEIKLPKVTHKTVEHDAMGISGAVEIPLPGITDKLEGNIKFKSYDKNALKRIYNAQQAQQIEVYGSVQRYNPQNGIIEEIPVKATIKAFFKEIDTPEFKKAQNEGAECAYSAIYYKLVVDGEEVVEIDKFNYIYRVDGEDLLETTRANLGMK